MRVLNRMNLKGSRNLKIWGVFALGGDTQFFTEIV